MKTAVLALAALVLAGPAVDPPRAASGTSKTFRFTNGKWFDGREFVPRTMYSVAGIFRTQPPSGVDETADLEGGWVVPPFADAHNHYISGPFRVDEILAQYIAEGVFYAKNPASIRRDTVKIADRINRPDSVDVVFANAGLTASGGHPVKLYEKFLNKVKTPGPDGTFENLAYVILDDEADLKKKWPAILADHPDFIKAHLLYSEEYEKRRRDPAYEGMRGMDPRLLVSLVSKAHESGLRISCHIETATDFRNALAADVDEINHLPGHYPDVTHPEWFAITAADAALAARKGTVVVTTTYVAETEMGKPEQAEELRKARAIQVANLKLLRDAGVKIAIGPDVFGVTSLAEALNLKRLGVFDNRTLLDMWCRVSAETIFPKRKIGQLRDGYEASFLVLGANPLDSFDAVKDIRMRFKQGAFLTAPPKKP